MKPCHCARFGGCLDVRPHTVEQRLRELVALVQRDGIVADGAPHEYGQPPDGRRALNKLLAIASCALRSHPIEDAEFPVEVSP